MPIHYTLADAANKYKLNHLAITAALEAQQDRIIGDELRTVASWGDGIPALGTEQTVTTDLSGGFTEKMTVVFGVSGTAPTITISAFSLSRTATGEVLIDATGSVTYTVTSEDVELDFRSLLAGADTLNGNAFDNILKGYGGNDSIDGGGGTDTVYFDGASSGYQVARSGAALTVSGQDGVDTLLHVERIAFDDKALAFDIDGAGGQAYRIYQAAFNRAPDSAGVGYWMSVMDQGASLHGVAQDFINSPEFRTLYGANPDNTTFITKLYDNVLHRAPDAAGLDYWLGVLNDPNGSKAQVLAAFSESAENQAALAVIIGNGFSYTPYA